MDLIRLKIGEEKFEWIRVKIIGSGIKMIKVDKNCLVEYLVFV